MSVLRALICAALVAFVVSPTLAQLRPGSPPPSGTRGAPGPVAGVGVPALVAVGGYMWFIRRKRRGKAKKHSE